jgi:hypothetical protein
MSCRIFILLAVIFGFTGKTTAAPFSPSFSDYPFIGEAFTVDANANLFFETKYGIKLTNVYLYVDNRDTFDGAGVANGSVATVGTAQTGRIEFLDLTDFVTVDYTTLSEVSYNAYTADGTLVSTQNVSGIYDGKSGSLKLTSTGKNYISYITFSGVGGEGGISNLIYNYDGITGGGNLDIPQVPEPASYLLLTAGLLVLKALSRARFISRQGTAQLSRKSISG